MSKFIEKLDDRYLACRDFRHGWSGPKWYREPDGTTIRIISCFRCWTMRQEIIDSETGEVLSRIYRYPDGYQWEREDECEERPKSRDFRAESTRRATVFEVVDRDAIIYTNDEY